MESPDKKIPAGIVYECINCNSKVTLEQLSITPEVKCPICGYRVLKKSRAPIVKHVKAR
jgi:DNA-directed RNA polymerase subunit RPC12/RpoP